MSTGRSHLSTRPGMIRPPRCFWLRWPQPRLQCPAQGNLHQVHPTPPQAQATSPRPHPIEHPNASKPTCNAGLSPHQPDRTPAPGCKCEKHSCSPSLPYPPPYVTHYGQILDTFYPQPPSPLPMAVTAACCRAGEVALGQHCHVYPCYGLGFMV